VEGYAFALRRSVLAAMGWFDERFEGAYCEDSDFGLRARQAGLRLGLVPGAVYHYGSVTTRKTMDVDARSRQNAARLRAKYGVGRAGASVLIVRQGARGDLLMLALALRSFVRTHPGLRVEVRCAPECAYLFEGNPDVALAAERTAYAQTFDLNRAYEDAEESGVWKHPVEHFCAALGVPVLRARYPLYLSEGSRARATYWLSRLAPARPRVGVGLRSAARPMSSWRETRWLALVRACPEVDFILLDPERNPPFDNEVGGRQAAPELFTAPNVLNLTGQTRDLKEVGAVLERCQACVSVDTAILHVANAVGCPVVGLFAGLPPAARLPLAGEAVGLAGSALCYPCTYPARCPPGLARHCLDGIEPADVIAALRQQWAGG
jgi:ADP-heptose:LPS heptosyltransferase